jgi:hypothetical protein
MQLTSVSNRTTCKIEASLRRALQVDFCVGENLKDQLGFSNQKIVAVESKGLPWGLLGLDLLVSNQARAKQS